MNSLFKPAVQIRGRALDTHQQDPRAEAFSGGTTQTSSVSHEGHQCRTSHICTLRGYKSHLSDFKFMTQNICLKAISIMWNTGSGSIAGLSAKSGGREKERGIQKFWGELKKTYFFLNDDYSLNSLWSIFYGQNGQFPQVRSSFSN